MGSSGNRSLISLYFNLFNCSNILLSYLFLSCVWLLLFAHLKASLSLGFVSTATQGFFGCTSLAATANVAHTTGNGAASKSDTPPSRSCSPQCESSKAFAASSAAAAAAAASASATDKDEGNERGRRSCLRCSSLLPPPLPPTAAALFATSSALSAAASTVGCVFVEARWWSCTICS
jgi:hypothetical protein